MNRLKFILALGFCFLWFSYGVGQTSTQDLILSHLKGNLYIFTTFGDPGDGSKYPANGMYILTRKGAILIDSPWDTTQFQPLLDSIYAKHNQKVVLNIATHFHEDRTAGFDYYKTKGIKTYSTHHTLQLCKARHHKQAQYSFSQDTLFRLGGEVIETYYPGHGHSPDNIVIWLKKHKVLFGGCLVKSTETNSIGNLSDADVKSWPNTMHNVANKYPKAKYVIPGHLGWADHRSIEHTLQIIDTYSKRNKN